MIDHLAKKRYQSVRSDRPQDKPPQNNEEDANAYGIKDMKELKKQNSFNTALAQRAEKMPEYAQAILNIKNREVMREYYRMNKNQRGNDELIKKYYQTEKNQPSRKS